MHTSGAGRVESAQPSVSTPERAEGVTAPAPGYQHAPVLWVNLEKQVHLGHLGLLLSHLLHSVDAGLGKRLGFPLTWKVQGVKAGVMMSGKKSGHPRAWEYDTLNVSITGLNLH